MVIRDIPLSNLINAPYLFNGSIFKYNDDNYIVYRANWTMEKCKLYVSKTDKDWNPIGSSWEIQIPILGNLFEDPRFILINNEPHVAVSQIDLKTECQYQGLVKLDNNLRYKSYIKLNYGDNWSLVEKQKASKKSNQHFINFHTPVTFEKNWCFLMGQINPTFIYSTQPVTVIAEFDNNYNLINEYSDAKDFNWPFGQIRGGAPAIKVNGIFYHFFHSSAHADPYSQTGENHIGRIYYMGCYTFRKINNKIELLQQSRIPLEMGDYTKKVELWRNAAVFPCGVVFENNTFNISYGWGDYKIKLLTIDHKELDSLLTPLQTPLYLERKFNPNQKESNTSWDAQEKIK